MRSTRRAAPLLTSATVHAALGILLAAGVVVAIVLATRTPSPSIAGNASSAAGAAIVRRRDLVETDTESGTLGYADPQTVYNRLSGTITWLPAVGQLIQPGQTLYRVNGRPVVLLDGELPAYRALKAKDSAGQDILQLNSDLVQMGFADGEITIDDAWQTGTTDAVERWQASLGEKQTGKIALGRIVFLPGAQRVTQLDTTCGSTGGGSTGGSSSGGGSGQTNSCGVSDASATVPASHPEFVDLTTSSTTTPTTTTTTTTTTTATRPQPRRPTTTTTHDPARGHDPDTSPPAAPGARGRAPAAATGLARAAAGLGQPPGRATATRRVAAVATAPEWLQRFRQREGVRRAASSGSGKGSGSGGSAASASAILQTTSTTLVVTVDLSASNQSEAKVGEHVTVEMPAGNTVDGTISAVSPVAQASTSGSGPGSGSGSGEREWQWEWQRLSGSTIPVTITLARNHPARGSTRRRSASTSRRRRRQPRAVRAGDGAARHGGRQLRGAGGGGAAQADPGHDRAVRRRLCRRSPGAGIHPGLQVTDSQG